MSMLNINPDTDDPFYRYKMPALVAKKEGRGNGKKTILANVTDLSLSLSRPPTYITKYFGCVLGAGTSWQIEADRYQVNGYYEAPDLQQKLFDFIREFVLCDSCSNPETVLSVRENKIYSKCKACGHQGFLKNQGHKLNNFIINNPPAKNKKDKKAKGEAKGAHAEGGEVDTEFDMPAPEHEEEMDDDDWAEDTSAEAVEKRLKSMVNGLGDGIKESLVDIDTLSDEERFEMFHKFLQEQPKERSVWNKVIAEGERLKFPKHCILALTDWAFDKEMLSQISPMKKLFHPFLQAKKAKKELMGGVEMAIGMHKSIIESTSDILKKLYKKDYLDEEVLLAWKDKGPTKKFLKKKQSVVVHEQAANFFTWLANHKDDDSDSDEDDDEVEDEDEGDGAENEDDDLEIGFSEKIDINASSSTAVNGGAAPVADVEDDEDSDIDIDAI